MSQLPVHIFVDLLGDTELHLHLESRGSVLLELCCFWLSLQSILPCALLDHVQLILTRAKGTIYNYEEGVLLNLTTVR